MFKRFIFNPAYLYAFFVSLLVTISSYSLADSPAPIRFLLTFDDGPSAAVHGNPTKRVLNVLAQNDIQPGIKAVFFTQTRAHRAGGSDIGRQLMRRELADGHVLAFHTSTKHHSNHRLLPSDEFELMLVNGVSDLSAISGTAPTLVRPPFWNYDARTLKGYHRHGLNMLLTDLSANDGVIWGVNWSWHKRSNLLKQLRLAQHEWAAGKLPVVDGSTPIIVTFHDLNTYTARNVEVYLQILLDVAHELNIPLASKPFYDDHNQVEQAALARTITDTSTEQRLPGFWNWLWK